MGRRAGAVVRALASHRCGLGSILISDHMWAKFVVVFSLLQEVFFAGYSGFPLSSKPALLNSNLTRNARTLNT